MDPSQRSLAGPLQSSRASPGVASEQKRQGAAQAQGDEEHEKEEEEEERCGCCVRLTMWSAFGRVQLVVVLATALAPGVLTFFDQQSPTVQRATTTLLLPLLLLQSGAAGAAVFARINPPVAHGAWFVGGWCAYQAAKLALTGLAVALVPDAPLQLFSAVWSLLLFEGVFYFAQEYETPRVILILLLHEAWPVACLIGLLLAATYAASLLAWWLFHNAVAALVAAGDPRVTGDEFADIRYAFITLFDVTDYYNAELLAALESELPVVPTLFFGCFVVVRHYIIDNLLQAVILAKIVDWAAMHARKYDLARLYAGRSGTGSGAQGATGSRPDKGGAAARDPSAAVVSGQVQVQAPLQAATVVRLPSIALAPSSYSALDASLAIQPDAAI